MQFSKLIGDYVLVLIPRVHPEHYQKGKLIGVEPGGIWIESQEITGSILRLLGATAAAPACRARPVARRTRLYASGPLPGIDTGVRLQSRADKTLEPVERSWLSRLPVPPPGARRLIPQL